MGRETCKPQWNTNRTCNSCVFCMGQSWSCNPPVSWLEKVAILLHPELAPTLSEVPSPLSGFSSNSVAPQYTGEHCNVGSKDEELFQVCYSEISFFMESDSDISVLIQEVASQTNDNRGLRRARSDDSTDTRFISEFVGQVSPSRRFCSFSSLTLRWTQVPHAQVCSGC